MVKKRKTSKTIAAAATIIQWRQTLFPPFIPAGYSNTGKNPVAALQNIRGVLGYSDGSKEHTHETMLGIISHLDSSKYFFYYLDRNKS